MQSVGSSATVTIPLSGFQTPLTGPVTSTVGVVAYEGDLGTPGDGAAIQGGSGAFTALSNAVNPGPPATSASNSNVFNSTISNAGALVTSRTPSFRNNLGYDADLFSTTNVLGNGQTSTQVRLSTSGDAYQPGVVTLATDLYAPRITATKTVDSATASLGDTLTYTVDVQNTGQDGATGTTFCDLIPDGRPCSSRAASRVNGAAVTDAAGDDLGEFAGGRVVARLGTGATPRPAARSLRTRARRSASRSRSPPRDWRRAPRSRTSRTCRSRPRRPGSRARWRRLRRPPRCSCPTWRSARRTRDAVAGAAEHVHDHRRQRR